jgi:hypothetical protein
VRCRLAINEKVAFVWKDIQFSTENRISMHPHLCEIFSLNLPSLLLILPQKSTV